MKDKSRREFEAHIKKSYRYPLLDRREKGFPLNGEYISSLREDEWRLWQAAWLASRAAIELDIPSSGDAEYWIDGVFQHVRFERDVEKAAIAAGLKVKGADDA